MQTILERFKTLEESGVPFDSVTDAHELEHGIARHFRAWMAQRQQMEKDLLTLWTPEEVKTAGLMAPRNPRQVLAELETAIESKNANWQGLEMLPLLYELASTFEPFFTLLPDPDAPES